MTLTIESISKMRRKLEEVENSPLRLKLEMSDTEFKEKFKVKGHTLRYLRPTYGEHLIINDYGFCGKFSISSEAISSFIDCPLKSLNLEQEQISLEDNIYNENILSVLHEDPDDLEFGGYSPLCDTAIYYFIEDYFEYDDYVNYAVSKESQERVPIDYLDDDDYDDEDDYDVTDKDGLDFWLYCATLNIKLKPLDCLPED